MLDSPEQMHLDVLFFDPVMHLQLRAKLLPQPDELPYTHPFAPLPRLARGVQHVPGFAEVVVEVVHVLRHAVVDAEVMLVQFGEGGLRWCWGCWDLIWQRGVCSRHVGYGLGVLSVGSDVAAEGSLC